MSQLHDIAINAIADLFVHEETEEAYSQPAKDVRIKELIFAIIWWNFAKQTIASTKEKLFNLIPLNKKNKWLKYLFTSLLEVNISFVKLMAFLPFQNLTENSEWTLKRLLRSLCEFLKLKNW